MTIRIGCTSAGATAQRWLIAMAVGFLVFVGTTTFAAAGPIAVGLATFSEWAVTGVDRVTESSSGVDGDSVSSTDPLHDVFGEPRQAHAYASTVFLGGGGIDGLPVAVIGSSRNDLEYARAVVQVQYQVVQDVAPPIDVQLVPLQVSGSLFASVDASTTAEVAGITQFVFAGIDFGDGAGAFVRADCLGQVGAILCDPDQMLPFVAIVSLRPGVTATMTMMAEEELVAYTSDTTLRARGSADPTVIIAPSFPFRDDYHLVFSPNLSPASVPEPPTLGLLLAGVAGLAVLKRRPCPKRR